MRLKNKINTALLGKGGVFLIANILNAMIPFFLLPVLTRVLSPTDYGIVAMFAIFLVFTNTLVGLSVHGAINVQYFKLEKERFSQYLTSCLILLLISGFIIFLATLLLGSYFSKLMGIPIEWLLMAVVASCFQFFITIRLSVWVVMSAAFNYGVFQISNTALNALASLFFVLIAGLTWSGRVLGQIVALILFGVLAVYLMWKAGLIRRPEYLFKDLKDALSFGLPLIPHSLGAFVIYNVDRTIVASSLGAAAVGIYMVGLQFGQIMGLVTESFNKVYSPWLMKNLSSEDFDDRSVVVASYMAMILILLCGVLWGSMATFLLPIIAGEEFENAASIVFYASLGFSITGLYYIVTNYIFYAKKTKLLAMVTFFCALINVPITYGLVLWYGLEGAVIAFVIIQSLFFLMTWILAAKAYPMPWFYFLKGNKNA